MRKAVSEATRHKYTVQVPLVKNPEKPFYVFDENGKQFSDEEAKAVLQMSNETMDEDITHNL